MSNRAFVEGPLQLTFPWLVEVRDEQGNKIEILGFHREKEEAEEEAQQYNINQAPAL